MVTLKGRVALLALVLPTLVFAAPAQAARWVSAGSDADLWYDADSVHMRQDHLLSVVTSAAGPGNTDGAGHTVYPVYSMIDCTTHKGGTSISVAMGEDLHAFSAQSGVAALMTKICP